MPQTVTITGVDDNIDDGDIDYSIEIGAASSSDANYSGNDPADIDLTNQDDGDTAGITVSSPSASITTETGSSVSFTIELDSEPTADVTLPISSSDSTEGSVSPTSIVFTASNWNVAQTVTVTGVDDNVQDGDVDYTVVIEAANSSDANYSGSDPTDINLTNQDNEIPGITVSSPSGFTTDETGSTISFTIVLDSEPTADVTLPISSSDSTEGSVSPTSIVFTASSWNVAQTVTVTGVDDNVQDGDVDYSIEIGAASSSDTNYSGNDPADIDLTNQDDGDTAGITVSTPSTSITDESGSVVTFTIELDSEPIADVTLPISSSDLTEGSVSPTSIVFTASNWNVAQTVTVTGVDDNVDDGDVDYSIEIGAASSSDANYSSIPPTNIDLTNQNDDANQSPIAVADAVTVNENEFTSSLESGALSVLDNDTDGDEQTLTAVLVGSPENGDLQFNDDGTFTYTHDGSETASDSFTYYANDGSDDSNIATVTITINPINDAPVANGESYNLNADSIFSLPTPGILSNDTDAENDSLNAILNTDVSNGTLTLNSDGSFSYEP
ncbi:MAG: calcium-binding protein, partial [Fuerstiella sp.]|nr:calcium-binding protein [Fuerstiella sp.]